MIVSLEAKPTSCKTIEPCTVFGASYRAVNIIKMSHHGCLVVYPFPELPLWYCGPVPSLARSSFSSHLTDHKRRPRRTDAVGLFFFLIPQVYFVLALRRARHRASNQSHPHPACIRTRSPPTASIFSSSQYQASFSTRVLSMVS